MKKGGAYGAAPGFAKLKLIKKKYKLKFFLQTKLWKTYDTHKFYDQIFVRKKEKKY